MRKLSSLLVTLTWLLSPLTQASSLPNWVTTPPGDSMLWFYSVGMGNTKQQAQQNALEELSSRLQITLQNNTQQFVEAKNGGTELYLESDTLTSNSNLTFTNVDIVNTSQYNNEELVLIKVDRQAFFQQLHDNLKETLSNYLIDNKALGLQHLAPALVHIIQYQRAKSRIQKQISLLRSYSFETFELDALTQQLTQRAQSISTQVGYQVIVANNRNNYFHQLTTALMQKMHSIGLTSDQKTYSLKVVLAGINVKKTSTQFHNAVNMYAELIYILDDKIIYQYPINAVSYSETLELAQQQSFDAIIKQLGTPQ